MQNTENHPLILWSNQPNTPHNEPYRVTSLWERPVTSYTQDDDMQCGYGHGRDNWRARRAFLTSYNFSNKNSFKERLKRSARALNDMAMTVFLEVRRDISNNCFKETMSKSIKHVSDVAVTTFFEFRQAIGRRKVGVKVYKLTLVWPTMFIMRCSVPWIFKERQYQLGNS